MVAEIEDNLYNIRNNMTNIEYYFLCKKIKKRGLCAKRVYVDDHFEQVYYFNSFMTFDIETTSVHKGDGETFGFMYIWQVCVEGEVIMGRTWDEFILFMNNLKSGLQDNSDSEQPLFACYVHNLAFEFQFMRNFFKITDMFATDKRKPLKYTVDNFYEFRCSYKLTNMSLDKFLNKTPNIKFKKQDGEEFDYSIFRTPITELTPKELGYCYCDVKGLEEGIQFLLEHEDDTIATIPMTSTGYLRREVRKRIKSNIKNQYLINKTKLSPELYVLCKTALRGGNAHANPVYAGEILVSSED